MSQPARGFEFNGGRVARVALETGTVDVDGVVIAAGAHSNELSTQLGSPVPLETERGYHVMLDAPSVVPRIPILCGEGKYFVTPMEDGLRIAGTVELGGLKAPPNYATADVLLPGGARLFPGFTHGKVEKWMGHRPSLPDSLPVLGAQRGFPMRTSPSGMAVWASRQPRQRARSSPTSSSAGRRSWTSRPSQRIGSKTSLEVSEA